MREIKFRAWDRKGMHYGGFSIHATGDVFSDVVKPEMIMQFTGLLDKNGVEIYEGDIIQIGNDDERKLFVFWDEYEVGWGIKNHERLSQLKNEPKLNVVIGNVHENPELIKP